MRWLNGFCIYSRVSSCQLLSWHGYDYVNTFWSDFLNWACEKEKRERFSVRIYTSTRKNKSRKNPQKVVSWLWFGRKASFQILHTSSSVIGKLYGKRNNFLLNELRPSYKAWSNLSWVPTDSTGDGQRPCTCACKDIQMKSEENGRRERIGKLGKSNTLPETQLRRDFEEMDISDW